MQEYTTIKGQSLRDVSAQLFGNVSQSVINEIFENNKNILTNDTELVGTLINIKYFYIKLPIKPGTVLSYDETSENLNKQVLRQLSGKPVISWGE